MLTHLRDKVRRLRARRVIEKMPLASGVILPGEEETVFRSLSPLSPESPTTAEYVCPITRQRLGPETPVFQCTQCQMVYSREGREFVQTTLKGCCCGCQRKNTIVALVVVHL